MSMGIQDRYGPYPKAKEKKRIRLKEDQFLKRSYEWLKWKMIDLGGFSFHIPCLER
jgi:hypothetical protein